MDKLFLQIINMSLSSSYVILLIIVARLFMKKLPKIFSYLLWMIAFIRLVVPISFESIYSLVAVNPKSIPEDIIYERTPEIQSGIQMVDRAINRVLPPVTVEAASINPIQIWIFVGSLIWLLGIFSLLIYSIRSTRKLYKSLKSADLLYDNIYEAKTIKTPFVLGITNPKIYLPKELLEKEREYIIEHEKTHIKRKDHIVKFLVFLITCVHWFNPLVWISFYLMGEDMELACDELVLGQMGYQIKKDYSRSLLSLSTGRKIIGGSPLAFGENNSKARIKNILNYKKPRFWIVLVSIILIIGLSIGLLSNQPKGDNLTTVDKLYKLKATRLQDESELWDILGCLDFQEVLDYHGLTVSIIPENYGLIIEFRVFTSTKLAHLSKNDDSDFLSQSVILFSLIENLDYVEYRIEDAESNDIIIHITRNRADGITLSTMGYKVSEVAKNRNRFGDFYEIWGKWSSIGPAPKDKEDLAWEYINEIVETYSSPEYGNVKFSDKEITKFEHIATFKDILPNTIELWSLDFRLKPEDPDKMVLAGGLSLEDGWLVDYGITGNPHLVIINDNGGWVNLGNANQIEFPLDSYASMETAIRIMLDHKGLLDQTDTRNKRSVVKFFMSTGQIGKVQLIQPVAQGDKGVWVVDLWMDGDGNIYNVSPDFDDPIFQTILEGKDKKKIMIQDFYKDLQKEAYGAGEGNPIIKFFDPLWVAHDFIVNRLGQTQVTIDKLDIIQDSTTHDFMSDLVDWYTGYIKEIKLEEDVFYLEEVEFLTLRDKKRASELGIDTDRDMPSGFYIYNPNNPPRSFKLLGQTQYHILNQEDISSHISLSKEEFIDYNRDLGYDALYRIGVDRGYAIIIMEEYIP